MKAQFINPKEEKQPTVVIDKRKKIIDNLPRLSDKPMIVVNYVEVGDMSGGQVQLMMQELNATFDHRQRDSHYVVFIRHGKISSDLSFGVEWLKVVNETCEIIDGEIKLKKEAPEIEVVRRKI